MCTASILSVRTMVQTVLAYFLFFLLFILFFFFILPPLGGSHRADQGPDGGDYVSTLALERLGIPQDEAANVEVVWKKYSVDFVD